MTISMLLLLKNQKRPVSRVKATACPCPDVPSGFVHCVVTEKRWLLRHSVVGLGVQPASLAESGRPGAPNPRSGSPGDAPSALPIGGNETVSWPRPTVSHPTKAFVSWIGTYAVPMELE